MEKYRNEGVSSDHRIVTAKIWLSLRKNATRTATTKHYDWALLNGLPKETIAAITILYRNTKVKVRSPDGDTEYFDILAGGLQGDTLAPYLFIICLDYVLRTSIDKIKENNFELTKKRSRKYRRRLRRSHSNSGKYTQPSRNATA